MSGEPKRIRLVVEEVYRYEGSPMKRFRMRIEGTKIVINVSADSVEEAAEKARNIIRRLGLERLVEYLRSESGGEKA